MGKIARPLADRFHEMYAIDVATGCWLWTGYLAGAGKDKRGSITIGRTNGIKINLKAHRASWLIHHGKIPDGLFVLHKCDVPHCVNPVHLFLGTQLDNIRDCKAKGRLVVGRTLGHMVHTSRLTEECVREIRKNEKPTKEYAAQFGVTPHAIRRVIRGQVWKHLS
jgi:hypothetical protein